MAAKQNSQTGLWNPLENRRHLAILLASQWWGPNAMINHMTFTLLSSFLSEGKMIPWGSQSIPCPLCGSKESSARCLVTVRYALCGLQGFVIFLNQASRILSVIINQRYQAELHVHHLEKFRAKLRRSDAGKYRFILTVQTSINHSGL